MALHNIQNKNPPRGDIIDIEFIEQLVNSMDTAVLQLEQSIEKKKLDEANKLRVFIFDLHRQIDKAMKNKNV
ncbi:MAG: hypothetical protein U9Q73_02180 [Nanoarchaeota archaeon]|nr:hypothetical protein [Nanoarchaeota archaeon]